MPKSSRVKKYSRIKGGEKNDRTGIEWSRVELEEVCKLYIEIDGKNIHENNPKIHFLAEKLSRTIRSLENQLLGFRKVATNEVGRDNYNKLIPSIWEEFKASFDEHNKNKISQLDKSKENPGSDFKFRISSQLKNIIGKDLITDDYLAIFELVKNSFDAHAKNVKIIFTDESIIIQDDGKGMSKTDILNRWLFVAYSAKKEGTEDNELENRQYKSYRSKIKPRTHFAGAKGIGRFSTDRLGSKLVLTTRVPIISSKFDQLIFDWNVFDIDANEKFDDVIIEHNELENTEYEDFKHGVVLEISNLHSVWPRSKILVLKSNLEKLINPFELIQSDKRNNFKIKIESSRDIQEDKILLESKVENVNRKIVNGEVGNFIFETLDIKTTKIHTSIVNDGSEIVTTLTDRGRLIYKIKEPNQYNHLNNTSIQLFYLNYPAKNNFTRLMGMQPVQFGNVFLFNNGFRVYPYGESTHDPFGIDRRKQQGYNRNLGSREIIGRVEILENSEQFKETTSRDGGLVETSGTKQLEDYFKKTLIKLENYVSPILWKIKDRTKNLEETIDFTANSQIVNLIAKLVDSKTVEILEFDESLITTIGSEVEESTPEIFDQLLKVATATGNKKFEEDITLSKIEFEKLLVEKREQEYLKELAEANAKNLEAQRLEEERLRKEVELKLIEEERLRKEEELKRLKAEEDLREENAKRVAEEQRRRQKESQVRFLESIKSLDIEDVLNLHHQIGIDANTIEGEIFNMHQKVKKNQIITNEKMNLFLERITFATKKILAVTKFTTKENFMAAARVSNDDIILFIKNYVLNILKYHISHQLDVKFEESNEIVFLIEFKPIEITIVIDNLLNNSKKKNAKNVLISFELISNNKLQMKYEDDGDGLDPTIKNLDEVFHQGFTTTKGSGLGLFHVSKILNEMNATITISNDKPIGILFILNFTKK